MEFFKLNGVHLQLSLVRSYYWANGILYIHFIGEKTCTAWTDVDKSLYKKLCEATGQEPE